MVLIPYPLNTQNEAFGEKDNAHRILEEGGMHEDRWGGRHSFTLNGPKLGEKWKRILMSLNKTFNGLQIFSDLSRGRWRWSLMLRKWGGLRKEKCNITEPWRGPIWTLEAAPHGLHQRVKKKRGGQ